MIETTEKREVRVSLKNQNFGFYESGKLVFWGRVCSGRKGMDTPKGRYKVLGKVQKYVSKKYGSAMPYAIRFTNQGHFLHVGELKSKPASHGCIRLSESDAKKIFALAKAGDSVTVHD